MTTLEQLIETAKTLPPTERQHLREWLQEQKVRDSEVQPRAARPLQETPQQQMERFRQAMDWVAKHRTEYLGQWVVLQGAQLISHGLDGHQVDAEARAAGIEIPFLVQVLEEPEAYCGGWL